MTNVCMLRLDTLCMLGNLWVFHGALFTRLIKTKTERVTKRSSLSAKTDISYRNQQLCTVMTITCCHFPDLQYTAKFLSILCNSD